MYYAIIFVQRWDTKPEIIYTTSGKLHEKIWNSLQRFKPVRIFVDEFDMNIWNKPLETKIWSGRQFWSSPLEKSRRGEE